jgi:aspartate carbamoyltransferase regulatory subunit
VTDGCSEGKKEMRVSMIPEGTVIDHIPPGNALRVLRIMGIDGSQGAVVSVVMNVISSHRGRKDVVKVEGRALETREMDRIALIAPGATINIIHDFRIVEKYKVKLPTVVEDILSCANPNCITNQREPVPPRLRVTNQDPLHLQCLYCERDQLRPLDQF